MYVARPITWKDATETGTDVTLYSKNVDLPEKWYSVRVITLPVVHFCEKCQKITKQLYVHCEFPLEYYPYEDSLDNEVQIKPVDLKCLSCMFDEKEVFHVDGLDIQTNK